MRSSLPWEIAFSEEDDGQTTNEAVRPKRFVCLNGPRKLATITPRRRIVSLERRHILARLNAEGGSRAEGEFRSFKVAAQDETLRPRTKYAFAPSAVVSDQPMKMRPLMPRATLG